jgi:hypothetical protein
MPVNSQNSMEPATTLAVRRCHVRDVEFRTWQTVRAEVGEESDTETLYELVEELNSLTDRDGDGDLEAAVMLEHP